MAINNSHRDRIDRRAFIAGLPALAPAGLSAAGRAAGEAGNPVRTTRLSSEYPGTQFYDQQERAELAEAYDSHSLFRFYGPAEPRKVALFERELETFMGARHCLAVTSGTAALHCALTALAVGPGDEVILPAWTWHSCYTTILMTGALPIFAEVDESFTIDPADLEKRITPQTKAVMPVHLFGAPADMDRILEVARKHNLKVLEDCAQCAGGQYKGKRVGTIGDIGAFSFQIHKLITAGEGGAIVTRNPELFERAVRFHDLGQLRPVHRATLAEPQMPFFLGINYRMNEMTGAVMRAQLRKLDKMIEAHRRNARYVRERVQELPGLKLRRSNDREGEIGWTVDFLLPDKHTRDLFIKAMNAENVAMSPPSAATPLPPFPYIETKVAPHPGWPTFNSVRGREIRYGAQCCPRTLDIFSRAATLTIGPKFTETDLRDIVAAVRKVHRAVIG